MRNSAASAKRIWIPASFLLRIFIGQCFKERQVLKGQRSEKYTSAALLANAGIHTFIDDKHAIVHNKIMVIDKAKVITESFNFTKAAEEKNAENLLIISTKEMATLYLDNWQPQREHSESYVR